VFFGGARSELLNNTIFVWLLIIFSERFSFVARNVFQFDEQQKVG